MRNALRHHWPEYLMEAAELAIFMISAATFGVLLGHPDSPIHSAIENPLARRLVGGCAMGLTAVCLIYSPWGKQSGAHMNPSVTVAFYRLGKISRHDAFLYVCAQFIGGIVGVVAAKEILGNRLAYPSVNYVATMPGPLGTTAAFAGEFGIAFVLMSTVIRVSNIAKLARFTGLFAGLLVAIYITFEDPLSGMSMNPARTLGSAVAAMQWNALWIYFTAPPLAMLMAAEVHLRRNGKHTVACAKLHHKNTKRCIHCGANMENAIH